MNQKQEFVRILRMGESELIKFLVTELYRLYPTTEVSTEFDNYIVAHGENPICLVAHVDTVGVGLGQHELLVWSRNTLRVGGAKGGILGADDRAGVFSILEIIRHCKKFKIPMPSIIFTNYEESGGRGVKALISDGVFDESNTNLFVELDRKGCNEYVFYTANLPEEVKDYVESFGYIEKDGSYSDIMDLAWHYKIPAVNLSIGYYSQHTSYESLHWDEMRLTTNRVIEMLKQPIDQLYTITEMDCSWGSKYKFLSDRNSSDGYSTGYGEFSTRSHYDYGFDFDWPGYKKDSTLQFDLEEIKTDLYMAIQEDSFWDLYTSFNENDLVLRVLDDFYDMFIYEVDKLGGWKHLDVMEPMEFDDLFDLCWGIAAHDYTD